MSKPGEYHGSTHLFRSGYAAPYMGRTACGLIVSTLAFSERPSCVECAGIRDEEVLDILEDLAELELRCPR